MLQHKVSFWAPPPPPLYPACLHCTCSEVRCLGIVTFEQGVAWPTGSYSMAVRPIEEHPCVLRGKGTQIKYATKMLRALLHAKPNISPISAKDKVWRPMLHVWPHSQILVDSNVHIVIKVSSSGLLIQLWANVLVARKARNLWTLPSAMFRALRLMGLQFCLWLQTEI